jgi:hypothetical protein
VLGRAVAPGRAGQVRRRPGTTRRGPAAPCRADSRRAREGRLVRLGRAGPDGPAGRDRVVFFDCQRQEMRGRQLAVSKTRHGNDTVPDRPRNADAESVPHTPPAFPESRTDTAGACRVPGPPPPPFQYVRLTEPAERLALRPPPSLAASELCASPTPTRGAAAGARSRRAAA